MPAACAKKFPGNLARRPVGASVDARARAPVDCRERAINERRGCNWRAAFCAGGGRRRDVLRTACFSRVVVVAAAVFIYRGTRPRKRGVRPNDAPVIYGLLRYTCFVAAALKRLCRKNNRFPSPPPPPARRRAQLTSKWQRDRPGPAASRTRVSASGRKRSTTARGQRRKTRRNLFRGERDAAAASGRRRYSRPAPDRTSPARPPRADDGLPLLVKNISKRF